MPSRDFPAVLVLFRVEDRTGEIHCFQDVKLLETQADVDSRVLLFRRLEAHGFVPYQMRVCHVDDAAECVRETRRELEVARCAA